MTSCARTSCGSGSAGGEMLRVFRDLCSAGGEMLRVFRDLCSAGGEMLRVFRDLCSAGGKARMLRFVRVVLLLESLTSDDSLDLCFFMP
jgi:hypothetical protein